MESISLESRIEMIRASLSERGYSLGQIDNYVMNAVKKLAEADFIFLLNKIESQSFDVARPVEYIRSILATELMEMKCDKHPAFDSELEIYSLPTCRAEYKCTSNIALTRTPNRFIRRLDYTELNGASLKQPNSYIQPLEFSQTNLAIHEKSDHLHQSMTQFVSRSKPDAPRLSVHSPTHSKVPLVLKVDPMRESFHKITAGNHSDETTSRPNSHRLPISEKQIPSLWNTSGQFIKMWKGDETPMHSQYGCLDFQRRFVIEANLQSWEMVESNFTAQQLLDFEETPLDLLHDYVKKVRSEKPEVLSEHRPESGNVHQDGKKWEPQDDYEDESVLVYKATIGRNGSVTFVGPSKEKGGNSLRRAFGEDRILQVTLEKEMGSLEARQLYEKLLEEGIFVGLRRYRLYGKKDPKGRRKKVFASQSEFQDNDCVKFYFVATESWSSSDLKDETFWEYEDMTCARARLAHFHTTDSMAKYEARTQLAMSKTWHVDVDVSECKIIFIPDIFCKDGDGNIVTDSDGKKLIHTDGCGFVSPDIASRCPAKVYMGSRGNNSPSVSSEGFPLLMQVRLFRGGNIWKAVLCTNHNLPPKTIQVRPSMHKVHQDCHVASRKLPPPYAGLELCNTSRKPLETHIFQHLVLLLLLGGVPEQVILQLAADAWEDIRHITKCRKKAYKLLHSHSSPERRSSRSSFAQQMLLAGFPPTEPFLGSVLREALSWRTRDARVARLPVRDTWHLMGCADPTGTLERDQVAVILGHGPLFSSKVLVYKAPGLHPGDVRAMEATFNGALEAFLGRRGGRHAILFSTRGPRSATDEMANSDLDGDVYWVCNHEQIVSAFQVKPPWTPRKGVAGVLSVPPIVPCQLSAGEKEKHLVKVGLDACKPSYTTGMAANYWVAHVDFLLHSNAKDGGGGGAEEAANLELPPVAYELIDLFYASLDSGKSGDEITIPLRMRPKTFPIFQTHEKDQQVKYDGVPQPVSMKEMYRSESVLGKVFKLFTSWDLSQDSAPTQSEEVTLDLDLKVPGYEKFYNEWNELYKERQREVKKIYQNLSTSETSKSKLVEELDKKYTNMFSDEGKWSGNRRELSDSTMAQASALYTVVYQKYLHAEESSDSRKWAWTLWFVWKVAGPILCYIKSQAKNNEDRLYGVSKAALEEILL